MGAHVILLATKESKSKRDNETRTEMELRFFDSIHSIGKVTSSRPAGHWTFFSLHDRSGLVLDAFLSHSHIMLAKQTKQNIKKHNVTHNGRALRVTATRDA